MELRDLVRKRRSIKRNIFTHMQPVDLSTMGTFYDIFVFFFGIKRNHAFVFRSAIHRNRS